MVICKTRNINKQYSDKAISVLKILSKFSQNSLKMFTKFSQNYQNSLKKLNIYKNAFSVLITIFNF